MEPFYYSIDEDLFSDELKQFLIEKTFSHLDYYKSYITRNNRADGNKVLFFDKHKEFAHDDISKIRNSFTINVYPVIILHMPNEILIKHTDEPNRRNCVLSIPLYPILNYSPTFFYKDYKDSREVAKCEFNNMKPSFLNTQQIHNVVNIDSYRFNFQFCFDKAFEEVVDLYKCKKLFKSIP